jgi:uncharacterized protein (TIGR02217 family)
MSLAIFPTLPGQGITVKKIPRFDTRIAVHASGRESRASSYSTPLFDFELVFDGLDASNGTYVGLGEKTMQTLAGFFMAQQGQAQPFLYLDPVDSVATGRLIGFGDGTTTTFDLTHSIGAYFAPIDCVISVTAIYLNGVRQTGPWTYPTPNQVQLPSAPVANVSITADYTYGYQVRFSEDVVDLEEFMSLLNACRTVKFQGVRTPVPSWAQATVVVLIVNDSDFVVPGTVDLIECYSGGAGGIGGSPGDWTGWGGGSHGGGGGGGYAYVRNPALTVGETIPITVGQGGKGVIGNNAFGAAINKGGDTYVGPLATPICHCIGAGGGIGGYQFSPGGPAGGFAGSSGGVGGWYPGLDVPGGSGGGGAGGPQGPGGNGSGSQLYAGNGGAGGGAGNGGSNGAPCLTHSDVPGLGGVSAYGGGAGGTGGTSSDDASWPDYPSVIIPPTPGGVGANEISELGGFAGSGGGGGGGGYTQNGAPGGAWGGGGGGGGGGLAGLYVLYSPTGGPGGYGGDGGDGGVAITYTLND